MPSAGVIDIRRRFSALGNRPLACTCAIGRCPEVSRLHAYVGSLLVAQNRQWAIANWKIERLAAARRWFITAILGVVLLIASVLGGALETKEAPHHPRERFLVPEVAVLGEDHRDIALLAGLDHLGVAFGAAGLDHCGGAGLDRQLGTVGEGEEGVGGQGGAG
jgi:hypothetical protein